MDSNGKEKDDEMKGSGNHYDLGFRDYDPRLGRMFKIDPRSNEYPWQSTYAYHRNSPIGLVDYLGGGDNDPVDDEKTEDFADDFREKYKDEIAKDWDVDALDTGKEAFEKGEISQMERDLIIANNKARTNPAKFAAEYMLPDYEKMQKVTNPSIQNDTHTGWVLDGLIQESAANWEEAITVMGEATSKQLKPLKYSTALKLSATSHTTDGAKTGIEGHTGSDGSTPFKRMLKFVDYSQEGGFYGAENISYGNPYGGDFTAIRHVVGLLVDDFNPGDPARKIPPRGHRRTILDLGNKGITTIGVSHITNHPSAFGNVMSVTNFGTDHTLKK